MKNWYSGARERKAVIVFFEKHNETFKNLESASLSLDIAVHILFDAIKKGYRVKTASGLCFVDWLEE